jgi:type IV pilus assembly protein PilM
VTKQAGVIGDLAEIEVFSSVRASVGESDERVMVFDYGASSVKMCIVERGLVHEVHTTGGGAAGLTTALAKALSIDAATAEVQKRQSGLVAADDARIRSTLEPLVDHALVEGKRFLDQYEADHGRKVGRVVLCGGGALLPGLAERAAALFGRDTTLANPFSKVNHPEPLTAALTEAGPSFAVALGVALRKLFESE